MSPPNIANVNSLNAYNKKYLISQSIIDNRKWFKPNIEHCIQREYMASIFKD